MSYPLIKFDQKCIIKNGIKSNCQYCNMSSCNMLKLSFTNTNTNNKNENENEYIICDLCSTIILYDRSNMYRTMFFQSKLSQKEVVQLTANYYKKHGKIPLPTQLDPTAKRLDISGVQLKFLMLNDEKIKLFVEKKEIVSFFNIEYSLHTIIPRNSFLHSQSQSLNNEKNNTPYWDNIQKMDIYKISDEPIIKNISSKKSDNVIDLSKKSLLNKISQANKNYTKDVMTN